MPLASLLILPGFDIAEFALDAALSERQMDKFLKLLKSSALDEAHLTPSNIKTRKDVKASWDRAANLVTPVSMIIVNH